jgi:hypothetical protein
MKGLQTGLLVFAMLWVAGCGEVPVAEETGALDTSSLAKGDAWDKMNNPVKMHKDLVFRLSDLPLEGEADSIPWPGSYWPTLHDSINYRWDGSDSLSPTEKYAIAFDAPEAVDEVSKLFGIDAHAHRQSCASHEDCANSEEFCGKRMGEDTGRCIPGWWGICHAWSPAAIREPEPVNAVTRNGVTFKVNDIKALMTLVYNWINVKHVSLRCESHEGTSMAVDAYGNPTGEDIGCKDTNAGTFHVITTNFLGLMGKSFVEDRTFDLEVWNQPVARYRTKHFQPVSVEEAHLMLQVPDDLMDTESYLFNGNAAALYHVRMELDYVSESTSSTDGNLASNVENYIHTDSYDYVLEIDADGLVIGGEWVGASKTNHPDFLWTPTGMKNLPHFTPPIAYYQVKSLLIESLGEHN